MPEINPINDALTVMRNPASQNVSTFQRIWRAHDPDMWARSPEPFVVLSERILKLGEPLLAYDVVAEGIKNYPNDVQLRQLLALALARSGAPESANALLVALYQEGHRDEETLGLLARTHKDLASEAAKPSDANWHLRQAYQFYTQAYEITGGYWSAINAATLALLLGERTHAQDLAQQIAVQCRGKLNRSDENKSERYWLLSTLGEASLLLNNWPQAEQWYRQAIETGAGDWGNLQSTRRNAALLLQHLDGDRHVIERLFDFPSVVVFTGHMIDKPGRAEPRFPSELESAVKDAIRDRLKAVNAGFGYASAACGADILFHEAMLEMGGKTHIVLPYEKDIFIRESVDFVNASWTARCERVLAEAAQVHVASLQNRTGGLIFYEFTNMILHGLAAVRAEQLQTKLIPLAVWDGKPGDGAGGTATTVEHWRNRGLKVEIIDVGELLRERRHLAPGQAASSQITPAVAKEAKPDFAPEIRALLFADAQGYSKLTDEEIPRFVHHFLGLVADLAAESAYSPLVSETWGDAFYFVFSNVREAGQFALDLRDSVRSTDWPAKGLPQMNLRVALHAGPVYFCTNPITRRDAYVGPHVSRAARIEPVTPPGQVYASQEFAALVAADSVKEIRCDYVGQTSMAKKYGTFPTYVVRRR